MKQFLIKYKHLLAAVYFVPYMIWFIILEKKVTTDFHVIGCSWDSKIPFCEYFIIPYLLWFFYIAIVWLYLAFQDKKEFLHYISFIYLGMTIFLIVSSIYPNGLNLRVDFDPDKNIFTKLVATLQSSDTPTNVFPSIHVFNSIGAHIAVCKSEKLKKHPVIQILSLILCTGIILSTVFLKQHSIIDVLGAFVLAIILYWVVYAKKKKTKEN